MSAPATATAARGPRYVVVTPVRDEVRFVGETIASMRAQTHLPRRWVIVDDGSTDGTAGVLARETAGLGWVTIVRTGSGRRRLGSAEVLAFERGLAALGDAWADDCDYVAKLDADLRFAPDYFERLLRRMEADPRWGIGSGVYDEHRGGRTVTVAMPPYHAAGASKVLRKACFDEIGGFVARPGWDTVDEIRAGLAGWRTGHADELHLEHLKPEGAAMGSLRTHRFHGEIAWQTGVGAGFLAAKALHRMATGAPPVLGGLALAWGYAASAARRLPRLVTADEARFYRGMLRRRLARPAPPLAAQRR